MRGWIVVFRKSRQRSSQQEQSKAEERRQCDATRNEMIIRREPVDELTAPGGFVALNHWRTGRKSEPDEITCLYQSAQTCDLFDAYANI